tara:strand:- start:143 stop:400 length:258 start_codon:yes stop_codon:yes gene_type:complete
MYLIFLLLIFIMMIYLSVYINYQLEKQQELIEYKKIPVKTQLFNNLLPSPDQLNNNHKYKHKKYNWSGCDPEQTSPASPASPYWI